MTMHAGMINILLFFGEIKHFLFFIPFFIYRLNPCCVFGSSICIITDLLCVITLRHIVVIQNSDPMKIHQQLPPPTPGLFPVDMKKQINVTSKSNSNHHRCQDFLSPMMWSPCCRHSRPLRLVIYPFFSILQFSLITVIS